MAPCSPWLQSTQLVAFSSAPFVENALLMRRQSRRFQFFVKYCTVFTLTLVVVLILSRISSGFRSWSPNNLLLTIVVVMSEKIELTVSKGVLRIFGTLVGGLFGGHP